jgi:tetratricopeptide (TPR) repeat protein
MRTTLSTLILCTVSALALSLPASAATIILGGDGVAHACYAAAKAGDRHGITDCTLALNESALTSRDRAATLINRSALEIILGNQTAGLADCDESIRTYSGLGEAYLNRGVALRALGRMQEAIASLDKGIEMGLLRPQLAYFDRALAKEDVGDVAGAYHDYKMALALEPGFALAAEQLKRFRISASQNSST